MIPSTVEKLKLCSCDVKVKTDPADVDPVKEKAKTHLTTYGRDEEYFQNKLSLLGCSSAILYGVGDGMFPWCCLTKKIPCLLIFGKRPGGDVHQKVIFKFLQDKVVEKMEAAIPGTRWFRTTTQLGCREEKKEATTGSGATTRGAGAAPKKLSKAFGSAPATACTAGAAPAAAIEAKKRSRSSSSDDEESDSASSHKMKKKKKE